MAQKNDNFSYFANTGYQKKFCCNPQLRQKLVFFFLKRLACLKYENIDVDPKTQLKIQKKNRTKKKGFERQSKTGNQTKQKGLMKKLSSSK